jgi:23S rRNA (pseudouridine1915-N3)-methyltransferase
VRGLETRPYAQNKQLPCGFRAATQTNELGLQLRVCRKQCWPDAARDQTTVKIRLIMLGKARREEIRALLDDYAKRIRHYAEIEIQELREVSPSSLRKAKLDAAPVVVLLDAAGKQFTSEQFAGWLGDLRDRGTREVVFLCGHAEGFPEVLRASTKQKIALSTLTMPHEFARVVLAEQIYRAFAILAGHPYPK